MSPRDEACKLRAIFVRVSPWATRYVPSATGAAVSVLLGAALLSGDGLGAAVLAAALALAARFAAPPEWLERFGFAAGEVAADVLVVSVGAAVAASGVVLTRGVCAGVGAVVAAATGAALLARSPGV
jgi:hypothetical protein